MSTVKKYSLTTDTQASNLPASGALTGDESAFLANMPEFIQSLGFPKSKKDMLVTIWSIVTVMCILGLASSFTMGGLLHIVLIIAMIATVSQAIKAEQI